MARTSKPAAARPASGAKRLPRSGGESGSQLSSDSSGTHEALVVVGGGTTHDRDPSSESTDVGLTALMPMAEIGVPTDVSAGRRRASAVSSNLTPHVTQKRSSKVARCPFRHRCIRPLPQVVHQRSPSYPVCPDGQIKVTVTSPLCSAPRCWFSLRRTTSAERWWNDEGAWRPRDPLH